MQHDDDTLLEHPWISLQHVPVYVFRFPSDPDDATLDSFCAARERWAKRARWPCAWVADMSQLRTMPSAKQRRAFAQHLSRFEAHDVAWNQGSAIVAPNALLKGALTAVFWMSPPKFPHQAFREYDDALRWAYERVTAPQVSRATR